MNTEQAFEKLKSAGVTDSIQTVRRWLRDGKIKATRSENRKVGFDIDEDDLQRFINERTGMDKDERIRQLESLLKDTRQSRLEYEDYKELVEKDLMKQRKELKGENEKLRDENKKLRMIDKDDDVISRRLKSINRGLHPIFKEQACHLDLDIAEWLSEFDMDSQGRLVDLDFKSSTKSQIRERSAFLWYLIKHTPITGKQINRYLELMVSLEFRIFLINCNVDDLLKRAETENEIDSLLDQLEKLIADKQNEKSYSSENNTFSSFGTSTIDYRQKLGLPSISTNDEVIKEYRKLIKILHPDKGGNAKMLQEIKEDYDNFRKGI